MTSLDLKSDASFSSFGHNGAGFKSKVQNKAKISPDGKDEFS